MTQVPSDPQEFSARLFRCMEAVNPGVRDMELYEFRYCLDNVMPSAGWSSVTLESRAQIQQEVESRAFYDRIEIKPKVDDRIVLDECVIGLTRMLFVGLVTGEYSPEWINEHFYFDLRGFYFLHRTSYFTAPVRAHLGGEPYRQFKRRQKRFDACQDIGYKEFSEANAEVDAAFMEGVVEIISKRGTPIVLAIAGPTAAGKTEIVDRLHAMFVRKGQKTSSIELDNFLTDRDERERKGIFTQGKAALHFDLFKRSLEEIASGKPIRIPRYDFVFGTSSHALDGQLKPGGIPIEIEPADIVFVEGNFPFLIPAVAPLIGIKVVYLTDDPIRLKRKWKRDIDYRKKYEPTYLRNRFFKEQFIMAEIAYRPQLELCDLAVDTTEAALWATPEMQAILSAGGLRP